MSKDEEFFNDQQNADESNREITPWLQKRLEDRARPLSVRGQTASESSSGQAQTGSRISSWITSNSGIKSILSRATSLVKSSPLVSYISDRNGSGDVSRSYSMLDLPWFNHDKNTEQEQGPNTDEVYSAKLRTAETVTETTQTNTRTNNIQSTKPAPGPFINRLVSPPITRKPTRVIPENINRKPLSDTVNSRVNRITVQSADSQGKTIGTKPASGGRQTTPVVSPASKPAHDISRAVAPDTRPATGRVTDTISRENEPDSFSATGQNAISESYTDNKGKTIQEKIREQFSTASSPEKPTVTTESGISRDISQQSDNIRVSNDTNTPYINRSTEKTSARKETSSGYTAQDFFFNKPLSFGKRIVETIPFVKNLSRKVNRAPEQPRDTIIKDTAVPVVDDNKVQENNSAVQKISVDRPDAQSAYKAQDLDHAVSKQPVSPESIQKKEIMESMSKDIGSKYKRKELISDKRPGIAQKITQSLPIINSLSRKTEQQTKPVSNTFQISRTGEFEIPSFTENASLISRTTATQRPRTDDDDEMQVPAYRQLTQSPQDDDDIETQVRARPPRPSTPHPSLPGPGKRTQSPTGRSILEDEMPLPPPPDFRPSPSPHSDDDMLVPPPPPSQTHARRTQQTDMPMPPPPTDIHPGPGRSTQGNGMPMPPPPTDIHPGPGRSTQGNGMPMPPPPADIDQSPAGRTQQTDMPMPPPPTDIHPGPGRSTQGNGMPMPPPPADIQTSGSGTQWPDSLPTAPVKRMQQQPEGQSPPAGIPQSPGTGQFPALPPPMQSPASQFNSGDDDSPAQGQDANDNVNQPDIQAIAREIFPLIKRMIKIERERQPFR